MTLIRDVALILAVILAVSLAAPSRAEERQYTLPDAVEAWLNSPHARRGSEAFTHWDKEGEIPVDCAACHSSLGLRDFLGGDGTATGKVDHPAALGSMIDCTACHSAASTALDQVTFPSGASVNALGSSAPCMVCHQGRQSTGDVNKVLAGLAADAVSPDLEFVNVHYRAAAASLMGSVAHGGYEYDGRSYAGRFAHARDFDTCASCHDPHGLGVRAGDCATCHRTDDPTAIRNRTGDADADGDVTEGVAREIAALHAALGTAIATYAARVGEKPIVYAPAAYPYFFADLNGNGSADGDEVIYPNRYQAWTPRLLKAAYNYQFVAKDPGIYAHNPSYAMQLMIDSLDDLAQAVPLGDGGWNRP